MEEPTKLNEQQLEMLGLFQNPMSAQDFEGIKRFAVKILARNIDEEMERLKKEKKWTKEVYERWGEEHIRSPYKR